MTVSDFTSKALQKLAELGNKIVDDLEESNDYMHEVNLSVDLADFLENLNDPLCGWTEHFKNEIMECFIERANLNEYAVVSWFGYYYNFNSYIPTAPIQGNSRSISSVTIVNGDLIITYTDGSTENAGTVGSGASIFVTDVTAVNPGRSVNIFYKTNTIGQNIVDYVETDDTELNIFVWWDGGKEWNGSIVANSNTAFPNTARISYNSRCFTANAVVDVTGLDEVVLSGNGGTTILPIVQLAPLPTVASVSFGAYPTTRGILQTELKDGDEINLLLTLTNSTNINAVMLSGSSGWLDGIYQATHLGNNQIRVTLIADHNFLVDTSRGVLLRLRTATGSYGDIYNSTGIAEVVMNNLTPTLVFNSITYPASQQALKNSETANVSVTVTNHDEIAYSSVNGEISIPSPTVYAQVKTVARASGDYNVISFNNYTVTAYRNSNGTSATYNTVVKIAHIASTLTVTTPAARLISGGNDGTTAQDHVINVYSTQQLAALPDLGASIGTLQNNMAAVSEMVHFTETIRIVDANKGAGVWTISATNLAGVVTTTLIPNPNYTVGGFARRRKYFSPFANEAAMGVNVVNVNKLNAWDKDLIDMTYSSNQSNAVRAYTIVSGNTIHWNDQAQVENNTTGLSFIEIEEIP